MAQRETEEAQTFSTLPISQAINILQEEGFDIATVTGWSRKMDQPLLVVLMGQNMGVTVNKW